MQGLEVSGAIRPIYGSLGVKRLSLHSTSVHSICPNEVDAETIIRAWCATVNDVRPHEQRLESEVVPFDFRE